MLRTLLLLFIVAWAAPALCAETGQNCSLIPEDIRAIATPDDCAIILISDPTNGVGAGLEWLGVGGVIACNADNSIIVWSDGYLPPPPHPLIVPRPPVQPPAVAPVPPSEQFLWPEGIEDAAPFDLDNPIMVSGD